MWIPLAALLMPRLESVPNGWRLVGKAQVFGIEEPFEFVTDGALRFRFSVNGTLPDINGFDGSQCWTLDQSGVAHVESGETKDADRLVAWVIDGDWNRADAPLSRQSNPDGTITLTCNDGSGMKGKLAFDDAKQAPASLTYWTPEGTTTWSFSKYQSFGASRFPTHMGLQVGKENYSFEVSSAHDATLAAADFSMPDVDTKDTSIDAGVSPKIEVKAMFGYLFVHPLVDGKDVGWFFLDTGAGAMVLDSAAAKTLDVPKIGKTITAGVVATVVTPIDRAEEFRLGPLTMRHPTFLEVDLAPIGKAFNLKLGGICGYDFLARVSLDIDAKRPAISIYAPGRAPLPSAAKWTQIDFDNNLMSLHCRFEGNREGLFTLDTGSGSTVDFMSPAVESLGLLNDRKTTNVEIGGAGGTGLSKTGQLGWFEIGGNRLTDLTAGFQITKTGAYASPYITGNIGAGILGQFEMLIDYQNQRISLAPYADHPALSG